MWTFPAPLHGFHLHYVSTICVSLILRSSSALASGWHVQKIQCGKCQSGLQRTQRLQPASKTVLEETAFSWIMITFLPLCLACWNIPLLFFSFCPIYLVTPHANLGTSKYTVPFEIQLMKRACVQKRLRLSENILYLRIYLYNGAYSLLFRWIHRMTNCTQTISLQSNTFLKTFSNELHQSGRCQGNRNLSRCCKQSKFNTEN